MKVLIAALIRKEMNPTPSGEKEYREPAIQLIDELSTLTLATSDVERVWAAPVYYVFYKNAFFFFSDPESLHITTSHRPIVLWPPLFTHLRIHGRGFGGFRWRDASKPVRPGITAVQALRAYIKKFPFTSGFFEDGQSLDLAAFSKRFRVKLYCFAPQQVFYLDNSIRFGFRTEIHF